MKKKKKKIRIKFLIVLISLFSIDYCIAQQVTNIRVAQEGDEVVITYDLSGGSAGETFNIEVSASENRGQSFLIIPKSLRGDLNDQLTGTNKKIIWSVLNEQDQLTGDGFVFRLIAIPKIVRETFSGNSGTFTDRRDGETYKWVRIGNQVWMAENLKTAKYSDGTSIPNVTDNGAWVGLTSGAYCWYNNDINNRNTYGPLYNWHAVNTGKLCPTGWHVPTDAEWTALSSFLGGESVAGGKMKSVTGWNSPNRGATNSSGFSALPGGYRFNNNGTFNNVGNYGNWWSSSENGSSSAWYGSLYYDYANLYRYGNNKRFGFSVRCVRD